MTIIHRPHTAQHVAPRVVPPAAVWDIDARKLKSPVHRPIGTIQELRTIDPASVPTGDARSVPHVAYSNPSANVAAQARVEAIRNVILGAIFGLGVTISTIAFADGGESTPIVPANYTPNAVTSVSNH